MPISRPLLELPQLLKLVSWPLHFTSTLLMACISPFDFYTLPSPPHNFYTRILQHSTLMTPTGTITDSFYTKRFYWHCHYLPVDLFHGLIGIFKPKHHSYNFYNILKTSARTLMVSASTLSTTLAHS